MAGSYTVGIVYSPRQCNAYRQTDRRSGRVVW